LYQSEAFVYYGPGDVRRETLSLECGPTDVMMRVDLCARCGTDRTIFLKGHAKVDHNAPIVLGHELTGRIVEVGSKVRTLVKGRGCRESERLSDEYLDFQPGERVTVQSRAARYANGLMLTTEPLTILSFFINGGYSQYMKLNPDIIQTGGALRVPRNVSDEAAALCEPAACALESIFCTPHPVGVDDDGRHLYRAGILPGGRACVIGSGTVSMIYARLAYREQARQVVMLVRSAEKASLAKRVLGNEVSVEVVSRYSDLPLPDKLAEEDKIVGRMLDITEGNLFDDVVAACADPDAQRLMLKLYNPQGYAVGACFGGTHALVDQAEIDANHYRMAKTIGSSGCSTRGMETVLRWLGDGSLSLDGFLASRHFTFQDKPEDFFGPSESGLKPALYPWE